MSFELQAPSATQVISQVALQSLTTPDNAGKIQTTTKPDGYQEKSAQIPTKSTTHSIAALDGLLPAPTVALSNDITAATIESLKNSNLSSTNALQQSLGNMFGVPAKANVMVALLTQLQAELQKLNNSQVALNGTLSKVSYEAGMAQKDSLEGQATTVRSAALQGAIASAALTAASTGLSGKASMDERAHMTQQGIIGGHEATATRLDAEHMGLQQQLAGHTPHALEAHPLNLQNAVAGNPLPAVPVIPLAVPDVPVVGNQLPVVPVNPGVMPDVPVVGNPLPVVPDVPVAPVAGNQVPAVVNPPAGNGVDANGNPVDANGNAAAPDQQTEMRERHRAARVALEGTPANPGRIGVNRNERNAVQAELQQARNTSTDHHISGQNYRQAASVFNTTSQSVGAYIYNTSEADQKRQQAISTGQNALEQSSKTSSETAKESAQRAQSDVDKILDMLRNVMQSNNNAVGTVIQKI